MGSKSSSVFEAITTKTDNLGRVTAIASVVVEPIIENMSQASKPKGAVIEIFEEKPQSLQVVFLKK